MMFTLRLFASTEVDGRTIRLPFVPSVGDALIIGGTTYRVYCRTVHVNLEAEAGYQLDGSQTHDMLITLCLEFH